MQRQRILVVEDDFLIRLTLSESLQDEGFEIIEAANSDDALTFLRNPDEKFDLLITDIQLAGSMDGVELARQGRQTRPLLRVLFMSGNGDANVVASPHDRFIAKPYLPSDLTRTARDLIAAGGAAPA